METFLNIALISLLVIGIVVFLKSPLEIIRNFFYGTMRAISQPIRLFLLPFPSRKNQKEVSKSTHFERIMMGNNSQNKLKLDTSEFSNFIIIKGDFAHSVIRTDIEEALSHIENGASIEFAIHDKGKTIIVHLTQVDSIADLMFIAQFIANSYGTDNTFGFQRSKNLSLFFIVYADEDLVNILGGMTSENERFFFSFENPKMDKNTVYLDQSVDLPKVLNTDFFEHLTKDI
ncbi:hypothetical protein [Roseivirga sp.]|uniref:hypothetical protein n=1 Tax=Roseivirga sp. TaxID=1964215 RepID=UPI002B266732|nr:hypothetical protein [Roseivirga sp.]